MKLTAIPKGIAEKIRAEGEAASTTSKIPHPLWKVGALNTDPEISKYLEGMDLYYERVLDSFYQSGSDYTGPDIKFTKFLALIGFCNILTLDTSSPFSMRSGALVVAQKTSAANELLPWLPGILSEAKK